jgi:hypothetical protein
MPLRPIVRSLVVPVLGLSAKPPETPTPKVKKKKPAPKKPQKKAKVTEHVVKIIKAKPTTKVNRYVIEYPISNIGAMPAERWWVMVEGKKGVSFVDAGPFRTEAEAMKVYREKEAPCQTTTTS